MSDLSRAIASDEPGARFFRVYANPKAYTSLLYQVISLGTGIAAFTWAVTGLSLSLGMMALIVGIPVALAFLASLRLMGWAEGRLAEAMLDVEMPEPAPLMPAGARLGERLGRLVTEGRSWRALLHSLLMLPLGIVGFVFAVTALSVSLGLMAAPFAHWFFGHEVVLTWDGAAVQSPFGYLASAVLGFLGLTLTLHLALLLGRAQGRLAKALLS